MADFGDDLLRFLFRQGVNRADVNELFHMVLPAQVDDVLGAGYVYVPDLLLVPGGNGDDPRRVDDDKVGAIRVFKQWGQGVRG